MNQIKADNAINGKINFRAPNIAPKITSNKKPFIPSTKKSPPPLLIIF